MLKLISTLMLLFQSLTAFAGDKGILFWIGEKLIGMDGYSYDELEQKHQKFLTTKKGCEARKTNAKDNLGKTDKELEGCSFASNYKQYPNERTIDYNLFDLLKSGCSGYMKLQRDIYYPGKETEVSITETKIVTKLDKVFKRTLVQVKRNKISNDPMESDFHNRIEFDLEAHIANYQPQKLPQIVLGRIYEEDKTKKTQNPTGLATYSYSVIENEIKQLEVSITAEKGSANESTGSRSLIQLNCLCPSVAELGNPDRNDELNKEYEAIRKKVFGN